MRPSAFSASAKLLQPSGPLDKTLTLTSPGTQALTGTLPYMAPEQLEGCEADERTDIHALGAILYKLATGQRPYPQENPSEVMYAILHKPPESPKSLGAQISEGLERIIFKCLEKEPVNRYASAKELIGDLDRLETGDLSALIAGKPGRRAKRSFWQRPLPVTGVLALAVLGFLFSLNIGGMRDLLSGRAKISGVQSLAVLPLKSLSQDPAQDYFAAGITDSLITELGQISTLRVTSSTSVSRYKQTEESLPQIAKDLKVDLIVEGSVLRSGEKVRITAKLIQPADERQLLAKTFERNIDDFLVLQSEIAGDITRQIGIRLGEETRLQLAKRRTVNPQAMDAYFKGVYSGDVEKFSQAVELDPDFALAYVRIAENHYFSGFFGDVPPREAFLKTKEAALMALEKDSTLGEAHGYLALALVHYDFNWTEAEKEFRRAFELNPSLAMLHHLYAHYLMAIDRMDESIAESKLALELDPFTSAMTFCTGWHCLTTADYDEAIGLARKGLQMSPESAWARVILGWAYEQKSMLSEAIAEFENALSHWKDGSLPLSSLAHTYGILGRKEEAREILEKLLKMTERTYVPAYDIAVVHMGLGEKEQALEWLNKALEERSGFLVYIKCDRRFDGLRTDPRYEALLNRIGLPVPAVTT